MSFLTQSPRLLTPGTTELQPRRISDSHNAIPDVHALRTHNGLPHSFSAFTESSEDELQPLDLHQQTTVLDVAQQEGGKLVRSVVASTAGFAEANIARRDAYDGVAVGTSEGQVRVVL